MAEAYDEIMRSILQIRLVLPALYSLPDSGAPGRASPQDRHEWYRANAAGPGAAPSGNVVYACRSAGGNAGVTVSARLAVKVQELVYPGTSAKEVQGKWLYVFRGQQVVAELFASGPGTWRKESATEALRGISQGGEILLGVGDKGPASRYAFLLSPVQLTPGAMDALKQGDLLARATVSAGPECSGMTLLLCDPAAWAADAHRLYYLPAATNYAKLITHPRFAAKTGIARTLERWCLERPELASRLKTQQQVWLQAFEEAKSDLMWQARKAMAYVACCVDAPDHHAMQCACDDRGGKDLSFGLQACAAVTEHICLTPEGTALARRMAFCQEFLPARHIFYEDKAPPNKIDWEANRWAWRAAQAIYEDVVPSTIEVLTAKGAKIRGSDRYKVQKWLENIGIPTAPATRRNGTRKALYGDLASGRKLGRGSLTRLEKQRVRREFHRLVATPAVQKAYNATAYDKAAKTMDEMAEFFEPLFMGTKITIGSLLELTNLCIAVENLLEARDEGKEVGAKSVALAGAVADALEHVFKIVEEVLEEGLGRRVLSGTAAVFAIASGMSDMKEFQDELEKAASEYEYGKALGHGMQMTGAAVGAVAGGLALAKVLGAGSLAGSALAGWLSGGAALLILGGCSVAKALELDDMERFALRSFLGKVGADPSCSPSKLPWAAHIELPTRDVLDEARALLMLEGAFVVKGVLFGGASSYGVDTDARVLIRPGLLLPGSSFGVVIRTSWQNWRTSIYELEVDLETDEIIQKSGPTLLKQDSFVRRDKDGRVEEIVINAEDKTLPADRPGQWQSVDAYVALTLNARTSIPDDDKWFVRAPGSASRDNSGMSSVTKSEWAERPGPEAR